MFTTVFLTNTLPSTLRTEQVDRRYKRLFEGWSGCSGTYPFPLPVPSIRKRPEALGPAISWAGVPGALVGGVWLSMSSRARAWWLAKQLVARLSLVAESAPSWGD